MEEGIVVRYAEFKATTHVAAKGASVKQFFRLVHRDYVKTSKGFVRKNHTSLE